MVVPKGAGETLRVRLDDPAGSWIVRYTDGISGAQIERTLQVKPSTAGRAASGAAPYPDAPFVSAAKPAASWF